MNRVLIVEDNKQINQMLTNVLIQHGYEVISTYHAVEALAMFQERAFDCVITDLKLPVMSGEELIEKIRETSDVHIIVITAKTTIKDKLFVLKLGADDYLYKPFVPQEIILKLDNLFSKRETPTSYQFGNGELVVHPNSNQIQVNHQTIELTAIEYRILLVLVKHPDRVITREEFLSLLYEYKDDVFDRVIDSHIKNIRSKLKEHTDTNYIKTVYGLGYSFVGDSDA